MRFWASGLACCIPIILGCLQYGCVHVNDCTCGYYDFRRRFKSFKLDQALTAQTKRGVVDLLKQHMQRLETLSTSSGVNEP